MEKENTQQIEQNTQQVQNTNQNRGNYGGRGKGGYRKNVKK